MFHAYINYKIDYWNGLLTSYKPDRYKIDINTSPWSFHTALASNQIFC